jgi:inorganic pyrophosphatase
MSKVSVYIEIEKWSNMKYEYDHATDCLELDRILPPPYIYPYAYGFVPNTRAADGDELDALILCDDHSIRNDRTYEAYILGALKMEDENGMDEKLLCSLDPTADIAGLDPADLEEIEWFFANYKTKSVDKWSKTYGFMTKAEAIALMEKTVVVPSPSGAGIQTVV